MFCKLLRFESNWLCVAVILGGKSTIPLVLGDPGHTPEIL